MNKKQRSILVIGLLLAVAIMLFPPWNSHYSRRPALYYPLGHAWIFSVPDGVDRSGKPSRAFTARIDTKRMFIYLGIVAAGTLAGILIAKKG